MTTTWYAVHSERHGREYYFNPQTNESTWILPDDAHPNPLHFACKIPDPAKKCSNNANSITDKGDTKSTPRWVHVEKRKRPREKTNWCTTGVLRCTIVGILLIGAFLSATFVWEDHYVQMLGNNLFSSYYYCHHGEADSLTPLFHRENKNVGISGMKNVDCQHFNQGDSTAAQVNEHKNSRVEDSPHDRSEIKVDKEINTILQVEDASVKSHAQDSTPSEQPQISTSETHELGIPAIEKCGAVSELCSKNSNSGDCVEVVVDTVSLATCKGPDGRLTCTDTDAISGRSSIDFLRHQEGQKSGATKNKALKVIGELKMKKDNFHSVSRVGKHCRIPFAYLFSKRCRNQPPLFNAELFVHGILE